MKAQGLPRGVSADLLELLVEGDNERARPVAADMLADAEGDGALAAALAGFGVIAWREGRIADALALLQAAVQRAERTDVRTLRVPIALALARTYLSIGAFDKASACVSDAQRDVDEDSECPWQPAPAIVAARVELASGRLDAAADDARRGLAVAERHGSRIMTPVAWATLTLVEVHRGDLQGAAGALASLRAEPLASVGDGSVLYDWVESRVREARDGPERAFAVIEWLYADPRSATHLFVEEPGAAPCLARIALGAGRLSDAVAITQMAARLAADNPCFGVFTAAAEHVRGLVDERPAAPPRDTYGVGMAAPGGSGPIGPYPPGVETDDDKTEYDKLRRRVLWKMPSGLYVLGSTDKAARRNGMTINWVTQLSFDPKWIGVGVEQTAFTHELIEAGGVFSVCLIDREDRAIVRKFTKPVDVDLEAKTLNGFPYVEKTTGAPVLAQSVAYLDCEVRERVVAGNHTFFVGEVVDCGFLKDEETPVLRMEDTRMNYGG